MKRQHTRSRASQLLQEARRHASEHWDTFFIPYTREDIQLASQAVNPRKHSAALPYAMISCLQGEFMDLLLAMSNQC